MTRPISKALLTTGLLTLAATATSRAETFVQTLGNQSWLNPIWGDPAAAPAAGNDYLTATGIAPEAVVRTSPAGTTAGGASDFPGNSLTIASGTRFLVKQEGSQIASINAGAGDLILDGGRLSLGPNAASSAVLDVDNFIVSGTTAFIDVNGNASTLLIDGVLRGDGDLRIEYENTPPSSGRMVSFAAVGDFSGDLLVTEGMGLDFNSDHTFTGKLTLTDSAFLQVDQVLTFPFGALSDPENGTVPAGTYTGDDLFDLGLNYIDAGGTVIVELSDQDADGLPDFFEDQIIDFDPDDAVASYADIAGPANAPTTTDFDGDGASDAAEYANETDPTKPDSDGDGLLDGVENNSGTFESPERTGTDPLVADSDGDEFSDFIEVRYGFDPTMASDIPGSEVALINGGFEEPVQAVPSEAIPVSSGTVPGWSVLINDFYITDFFVPNDVSSPAAASEGFQFATAVRTAPEPDVPSADLVGGDDAAMSIVQEIDLTPFAAEIDAGTRSLLVSFDWSENDPADRGRVSVVFLDASGTDLGRPARFITRGALDRRWNAKVLGSHPPAGARTARLILEATNQQDSGLDGGGSLRNVAFDNFSSRLVHFDLDEDLLADDWELEFGLDPDDNSDPAGNDDGDSLTNLEEFRNGTNPTLADTDGDGFDDDDELAAGSDPTDDASFPVTPSGEIRVIAAGFFDGRFEVTVSGLDTAVTYDMKRSPDLNGFPTVVDTVTPVAETETFVDPTPPEGAGAKAFYIIEDRP